MDGDNEIEIEVSDCSVDDEMDNISIYESDDDEAVAVNDLEFIACVVDNDPDPVSEPLFHKPAAGRSTDMHPSATSCEVDSDSDSDDSKEGDAKESGAGAEAETGMVEESDSDSDSDDEDLPSKTKKSSIDMNWLTEEEESVPSGPPRTKNEIEEEVLAVPEEVVDLSSDVLDAVGKVQCFIPSEGTVIVQAAYTTSPLVESSVLCLGDGSVLGRISEIFGPVCTPFYIIRLPVSQQQQNWGDDGKCKPKGKGKGKDKKVSPPHPSSASVAEVTPVGGAVESEAVHLTSSPSDPTPAQVVELHEPMDHEAIVTETSSDPVIVEEEASQTAALASAPAVVAPAPSTAGVTGSRTSAILSKIAVGIAVFTAHKQASYITPVALQQFHVRGSDASNVYDEEIGAEEEEFSDDEAELEARQKRNQLKRAQTSRVGEGDVLPGGRAVGRGGRGAGAGGDRVRLTTKGRGAGGRQSGQEQAPLYSQALPTVTLGYPTQAYSTAYGPGGISLPYTQTNTMPGQPLAPYQSQPQSYSSPQPPPPLFPPQQFQSQYQQQQPQYAAYPPVYYPPPHHMQQQQPYYQAPYGHMPGAYGAPPMVPMGQQQQQHGHMMQPQQPQQIFGQPQYQPPQYAISAASQWPGFQAPASNSGSGSGSASSLEYVHKPIQLSPQPQDPSAGRPAFPPQSYR